MSREPKERIAARLREACIHDPLIGKGDFVITLDDNLLAIRGDVPNAAAKERVTALARQLAPDLGIDNGLVVSVTNLQDDEILTTRANTWLAQHYPGETGNFGVTVDHGKAILRGQWPSLAAVQAARKAIGALPGVKAIDSALVTLPYREAVPGVGLVPKDQLDTVNLIEERLAREGYRLGDWVDASMYSGTVELFGIVDTPADADKVAEIAARTPGVRRVFSHLISRSESRDADREAEQRINLALGRPGDAAEPVDVQVFVVGDRAYLRGQVDTPEAKEQAVAIALHDPAVKHVSDRIQVVTRRSRPKSGPGTTYRRRAG